MPELGAVKQQKKTSNTVSNNTEFLVKSVVTFNISQTLIIKIFKEDKITSSRTHSR